MSSSLLSTLTLVLEETTFDRPRVRLASSFRRYWQTELWTVFFDTLLNDVPRPEDTLTPPRRILMELADGFDTYLATLQHDLTKVSDVLMKSSLSCLVPMFVVD